MEPLISPWIIYFIGWLDSLSVLFCIMTIFGTLFGLVYIILSVIYESNMDDSIFSQLQPIRSSGMDQRDVLAFRSLSRKALLIFKAGVIALILNIISPSKETAIAMIVANAITPNNINTAVQAGKDIKDEIVNDVIKLLNGTSEVVKEVKETISKEDPK